MCLGVCAGYCSCSKGAVIRLVLVSNWSTALKTRTIEFMFTFQK